MNLLNNKLFGQVIIVTEGEKDEIDLFEKIFTEIFSCEVVSLTHRDGNEGDFICRIFKRDNAYNKVLLLNARHSNIKYADDVDFLNKVYSELVEYYSYDIDIENSKVYYVFDRDCKSNNNCKIVLNLIEKFKDPYGTDDMSGLLILNYPSIESYIIAAKIDNAYNLKFELGKDIKKYMLNARIKAHNISNNDIEHAYNEFKKYLQNTKMMIEWDNIVQNIKYDYKDINEGIFNNQENLYNLIKKYQVFSSISMIFYSLGLIGD